MSQYQTSAVAFGDLKNAALYYDRLIPVNIGLEFPNRENWEAFLNQACGELLPEHLLTLEFANRLADLNDKTFNWFKKHLIQQHGFAPGIPGLTQNDYEAIENTAVSAYFQFVADFDLKHWPLAVEDGAATAWMPDDEGPEDTGSQLLLLNQLAVIDASKTSWQHIMEFRADQQARMKLRRLRLFAYDYYSGKSRAFIEDDLLTRLYDYEQTAKTWALETVRGSIGNVLQSKYIAGASASALVSLLFGSPTIAVISAGAGAALEIGNITLEIIQKRIALQRLADQSPISYLTYARDKLPTGSRSDTNASAT